MSYPIFSFDFSSSTIDLKQVYPIGSILLRSSPLADKVEWTNVNKADPHFLVDWEGMTWELIVDSIPSRDFYLAYTQVHSIRNCRLRLTATEGQIRQGVLNGRMIIDNQDIGTFQLDTFTGENSHKLTEAEMPKHLHNTRSWASNGGDTAFQITWNAGNFYYACNTEYAGGDQPHNNKEYAYNLFMYKRIA